MIKRIALLVVGVCAALALSATPAHADAAVGVEGPNVGTVEFKSYGEHLYVNDWKADGYGVSGRVWVRECSQEGRCYWSFKGETYNGNGYHGPPAHRNMSIKEDRKVRIQACLIDGGPTGTIDRCGGYQDTYA